MKLSYFKLALTLIVGIVIGGTLWSAIEEPAAPPEVIKVVIEEPVQVTGTKAQADAEVAAYNRGMEAGKFVACDVTDIERKVN